MVAAENLAFFKRGKQGVAIHEGRRRHFQIEPAEGGSNAVVRGAPIRHDNAIESPFFLEDVVVQMIVLGHVAPLTRL